MHHTFKTLESVLKDGLAQAKSKIFCANITSLPDELLVDILWRILEAGGTIRNLSRTCRQVHWRIAALPQMWTKISTAKNPIRSLERSAPLNLDFTVHQNRTILPKLSGDKEMIQRKDLLQATKFLSLVGPHACRWNSFTFNEREVDEVPLLEILASESYPKFYPSLRHVKLNYHYDEIRRSGEANLRTFISYWQMPILESLSVANFIPSRLHASPSRLTLKLEYYENNGMIGWDFSRLSLLLTPLNTLRELSISLHAIYDGVHVGPPAILGGLEKLSLRISKGSPDALQALLASFEATGVRDLTLHHISEYDPYFDDRALVDVLFPIDKVLWPRVERLNFSASYVHDGLGTPAFHLAMSRLPRINALALECEYMTGKEDVILSIGELEERRFRLSVHPLLCYNHPSYPPLRTLTLTGCPFDETFFDDNSDIIMSSSFEKLEICENIEEIDKDTLRRLIPNTAMLVIDEDVVSLSHSSMALVLTMIADSASYLATMSRQTLER